MGQECCKTGQLKTTELPNSYDLMAAPPEQPTRKMVRKKTTLLLKKLSQLSEDLALEEKKESDWLKDQQEIIEEKQQAKDEHLDFHELIHLFQRCKLFYRNHDIDSACDIAKQVHAAKASIVENRDLDQPSFLQLLRNVEEEWQQKNPEHKIQPYSSQFIESIEAQMKEMLYYLNQVDKQPFFEKFNEDGVKISTRKDGNTYGTLIQCQLKVPFEYFAYVLQEIPLLTDVLPYSEKSQLVKDLGRNSKLAYSLLNPPFVKRREAYFLGTAYFRFKHTGQMFIYTRSVHDNPGLQKKLGVETPLNKDYVSLIYKYFVITYEPISQGVGKLKFAYNVDNGVHFLPNFVEDYITRDFGKTFFYNILNACRNFEDSKWEESMINNPGITVFAQEQIKEHLERMKNKGSKQMIVI